MQTFNWAANSGKLQRAIQLAINQKDESEANIKKNYEQLGGKVILIGTPIGAKLEEPESDGVSFGKEVKKLKFVKNDKTSAVATPTPDDRLV